MNRYVTCLVLLLCVLLVECLPTMYKLNDNKKLEPDLIPVSSTVIPLPVYKVGYGINAAPVKGEKSEKPTGPIELITAHSKKKPLPIEKPKRDEGLSSVKQISKKEYTHN